MYWPNIKRQIELSKRGVSVYDTQEVESESSSAQSHTQVASITHMFSTLFPNSPQMPKVRKKIIAFAIGALIILTIIIDGLVFIPAGHVGVIFDLGRGVLQSERQEGVSLKIPFWQSVQKMDTRLQVSTMSIDPNEGDQRGDDSIESLTKDGQKVNIDITMQYRINGDDAPWIYQQVGLDYAGKVLRPGIRNVARDIVTGYDSTQLFTQETRLEAQNKMKDTLQTLYDKNKIQLEEILLRNIRFSEVYLQAIEDKQVAQQRIQKAEYERQESEKTKEKKIIEAQAEAEAIRLKGETLRANPQVIQFEFVQKMADDIEWGILPDGVVPLLDLKNLGR
jgi:regulator of protease activity HflC (stomatin/prohibitin superfamily)